MDDGLGLTSVLANREYRGSGYVRCDRAAYHSTLHPTDLIHVYVSAGAWSAYGEITPDATQASDPFPMGGTIVREVVDANDRVTKLTVMAKMGRNWFSGGGDFFFGVTDPAGNPLPSDDGSHVLWGKLAECGGCHETRANENFLFGVPMSERKMP